MQTRLPTIFYNAAFVRECERWLSSPSNDLRPPPLPSSVSTQHVFDTYMDRKRKREDDGDRKRERRKEEKRELDNTCAEEEMRDSPAEFPMTETVDAMDDDCYIDGFVPAKPEVEVIRVRPPVHLRKNPGTDLECPTVRSLRLPAPAIPDEPPNRNISVQEWWEEEDDDTIATVEEYEYPPTVQVQPVPSPSFSWLMFEDE